MVQLPLHPSTSGRVATDGKPLSMLGRTAGRRRTLQGSGIQTAIGTGDQDISSITPDDDKRENGIPRTMIRAKQTSPSSAPRLGVNRSYYCVCVM